MTPALILRTVDQGAMGKPCCDWIPRANADAVATAERVGAALAVPVVIAKEHARPRAEEWRGLNVVRYAFRLFVPGRAWAGSGAAQDGELLNPANWRTS